MRYPRDDSSIPTTGSGPKQSPIASSAPGACSISNRDELQRIAVGVERLTSILGARQTESSIQPAADAGHARLTVWDSIAINVGRIADKLDPPPPSVTLHPPHQPAELFTTNVGIKTIFDSSGIAIPVQIVVCRAGTRVVRWCRIRMPTR